MSIREIISEKLKELQDIDALGANRASEVLIELSSLLASIGKECSDRKYWLNLKKLELLKEHGSAAKAIIHAEGSPEYQQWLEAEEYRKAVIENIRAIKYFLRNQESELRESKF